LVRCTRHPLLVTAPWTRENRCQCFKCLLSCVGRARRPGQPFILQVPVDANGVQQKLDMPCCNALVAPEQLAQGIGVELRQQDAQRWPAARGQSRRASRQAGRWGLRGGRARGGAVLTADKQLPQEPRVCRKGEAKLDGLLNGWRRRSCSSPLLQATLGQTCYSTSNPGNREGRSSLGLLELPSEAECMRQPPPAASPTRAALACSIALPARRHAQR